MARLYEPYIRPIASVDESAEVPGFGSILPSNVEVNEILRLIRVLARAYDTLAMGEEAGERGTPTDEILEDEE